MKKPPKNVNVSEAVAWAAYNYERVVSENHGRVTLNWEAAEEPPPNDLAKSYMRVAANSPANFFSKIVPHFMGEKEQMSEEDLTHDKKLVIQIRSILKKLADTAKHVKVESGKKHVRRKQAQGGVATRSVSETEGQDDQDHDVPADAETV